MPSVWIEEKDFDKILHNKYGVYSKSELEQQIREGNLTINELGKIYSLSEVQIVHVLRLLNLTHRNILSDTRISSFEITPSIHQVILGTLLGDAYMKEKNSFMLGHSIHQMDYFYTVAEKLGCSVSTIYYKRATLGKSLSLWTNRHPCFETYFERFYLNGKKKKRFSEKSVYDLEPEGLAYWYMDDGKFDEYGLVLCTGGFSREENWILIDLLRNKFSVEATEQYHDRKKDYRYLYIKAESRGHFISLIEPYVIPSMRYKLEGKPYPKLSNEIEIAIRHMTFCEKIDKPVRFSGNSELKKMIVYNVPDKKIEYMNSIRESIKERKIVSHTNVRKEPSFEELKALFKDGLTDQQIASRYGFGRNRISKIRRSLNIPRKSVRCSSDRVCFPCMKVKLVPSEKVVSNEYNPNKVAHTEMSLLIHSIEEDGLTQPVVVFYDSSIDKYIVIDGFHRFTVLKDHFKVDKIPVVVLEKKLEDRMASTIRHNRARGKHQVDLMGILVNDLSAKGWLDEQIAQHLGMEGEELLRLRQQVGCAKYLAGSEYSSSWEIK